MFFSNQDDPELLEIKPTEDDIIDKDEEMNEDESAEIQVKILPITLGLRYCTVTLPITRPPFE